jgi:hypothetical protein
LAGENPCFDLWQKLHRSCAKHDGGIIVSKVDARKTHVTEGSISEQDYAGNSIADALADVGATGAQLPDDEVSNVSKYRAIAKEVLQHHVRSFRMYSSMISRNA